MSKTCMFGKADSAESSNDSINQPNPLPLTKPETSEINPFVCYRCSKRFPSLFALGGHQNAHKKERDEERKVSMERILAMQKQASPNSPAPLTIVPPVNVINSMPFRGPMVQVQPPQLMVGAGYERQKAPVLFVSDARFGPYGSTRTADVVKGAEGNQYCYHPYKKPANKQSMALKLFAYEESGFGGEAEEDSACSRYNYSASPAAAATATTPHAAACADHQINTSEEELDLTLRL